MHEFKQSNLYILVRIVFAPGTVRFQGGVRGGASVWPFSNNPMCDKLVMHSSERSG